MRWHGLRQFTKLRADFQIAMQLAQPIRPDPERHGQRFYGVYSNRGRIALAASENETNGLPAVELPALVHSDMFREAGNTRARPIKKNFEAYPCFSAFSANTSSSLFCPP